VVHLLGPAEGHRPEERHRLLHVRLVEEGQGRGVLREALAVQVPGVLLLEVRGVEEEDLREVPGGRRAEDGPPEPLPHEARETADVVEVGVGEDDRIDLRRIEVGLRPVPQAQLLLALEHPGVDEEPPVPRLQEVLGPGDRPRRPEEDESHASILRSTACRMPPFL
jgi:hypothetical protein